MIAQVINRKENKYSYDCSKRKNPQAAPNSKKKKKKNSTELKRTNMPQNTPIQKG